MRFIIEFLGIGMLCYGVYQRVNSGPLPVKFKSFDELDSLSEVARWAHTQFLSDDPRSRAFALLATRIRPAWLGFPPLPVFVRISVEDLATLAPYIDQAIDGKGPKQNLPAEYEDWRRAALRGFKARIESEGYWPIPSQQTSETHL